jgi:nitrite reductase/ring-hydroxylating ferredoxin subunit
MAELDIDSIPEDGACEVRLQADDPGSSVIVLRRGGTVHAWRNLCPHAGRYLNWAPGRFLFDQGRLVCAAHGAVFEVESGVCVDGPCRGSGLVPVPVAALADGRVRIGHPPRAPDPTPSPAS